jgi:hypothetical protein
MTRFEEVPGSAWQPSTSRCRTSAWHPRSGGGRPDRAAGRRHGFAVRTCSEGVEYCLDAVEAFLKVLHARREGKAEVALT